MTAKFVDRVFRSIFVVVFAVGTIWMPGINAVADDSDQIVGWGYNYFGQAGSPGGLTDVIAIAAGAYHNLALKGDGTVVAWGNADYGNLNVPAGLANVIAIDASFHNLALKSDGTVVAWGYNSGGQTNVPVGLTGVTAVATGYVHSLALKSDGTVIAWGFSGFGQSAIPVGLTDVIAIDDGAKHSIALKSDGTIVAWGNNDHGQINVPGDLTDVIAIAAGDYHNLALKNDGTVVAWGSNFDGQTAVPAGLTDVTAIAAGAAHSLALKSDGTVVAWGSNNYGGAYVGQATVPAGLTDVITISAGKYHSLALLETAPSCLPPPSGLIAWWQGNGTTQDSIGGRNAALRGDATFGVGLVDQAFVLDGDGDFVEVPDNLAFNFGAQDFTVDLWAKFNTTEGEQILIEKYIETFDDATRAGWTLTKLEGNSIRLHLGHLDGGVIESASLAFPMDTWTHFALRRSGNVFTIFVDGAEVASGNATANLDSTSTLKFGHRGNPDDTPGSTDTRQFYLNGSIDDVEIYGRALTDAEIASLFDAGSAGKCNPAPVTTKIGLVTDYGGASDLSFNQMAYEGLLRAESTLGIDPSLYESDSEDDYLPNLQQCAADRNELCLAVGFFMADAVAAVAANNPGTSFAIMDYAYLESPPANLRGVLFTHDQVGYLAGALAGRMTSGNVIGAVAGMEIPPVTAFVDGYRNGAQCANPNVNVLVNYTGSFDNRALGEAAAQDMLARGADVLFGVGGENGNGGILYGTQHGAWGIGVDTDQYLTLFGGGSVSGSDKLLTSAKKNIDVGVYKTIEDYLNGLFSSQTVTYDLSQEGVAVAPYHETVNAIPQDVKDYAENVRSGIINGTININETCREEIPVGLISYWNFDEGSGSSVSDVSPADYGNTGTLTNDPQWVSSPFGSALSFHAASDQYVSALNNGDSLSIPSGGITITAWINPSDVSGVRNILAKDKEATTSRGNYSLAVVNGKLRFGFSQASDYGDNWIDTQSNISTNRWYFVAVTHTFGDSSATAIYIDGVIQPLSAWQCDWGCDPDSAPVTFTDPLYIGKSICNGENFDGAIDEVKIYNRVLSPEEIVYIPVYDPTFTVWLNQNKVDGYGWPEGAQVTLTVGDPASPEIQRTETVGNAPDIGSPGSIRFQFGDEFTLLNGQTVTLSLTDGSYPRSHTITDLIVTAISADTNTVAGTAAVGSDVNIYNKWNDQIWRHEITAQDGSWTADFNLIGDEPGEEIADIKPGEEYHVCQSAQEGSTCWYLPLPNPSFAVRANDDRVEGWGWTLGTTITVTVDDPNTPDNPDITRSADVYEAPWNPGEFRFDLDLRGVMDIQPGFEVTVSDGNITKTHIVTSLAFTNIDLDLDVVTGVAAPNSHVDIWACDNYGNCTNRHIDANNDGIWTADFGHFGDEDDEQNTFDIVPGTWIDSSQGDEDGDNTMFGQRLPNPYIEASPNSDWVHAREWPIGTIITMTISGSNEVYTATMAQAPWNPGDPNDIVADFDLRGYDVKAGDVITATGNGTSKTLTVSQLEVTDFDLENDLVSGKGTSGAQVQVCANVPDRCITRWVTPDGDGNWTANFHEPGTGNDDPDTFDVQAGSDGWAAQYDDDSDRTWYDWRVPNPYFDVRANWDQVGAWEWPLGTTLILEIDNPATPDEPDKIFTQVVSVHPEDPRTYAEFNVGESIDIQAGFEVSLSDGTTTKTLTVSPLSFTSVDIENDLVHGIADQNVPIGVWACDESGCYNYHTTSDGAGIWVVDMTQPSDQGTPFNIVNGAWIDSEQRNEYGDSTMFGKNLPNPTIGVRANDNRVEGWEWPLGVTVTVTVDDPATPDVEPDITRFANVYEAPWNPGEFRFDLDLNGVIDIQPGFLVATSYGDITKQLIVSDFRITGYDLDADTVYGEAEPNQYVNVWTCWQNDPCINRDETADGNGDWSTNFAIPGEESWEWQTADLQPGSWIDSSVGDEDGDQTLFGMNVKNPFIIAFPEYEAVEGWEWPDGSTVYLAIDDPETPELIDFTQEGVMAVTTWGDPRTYIRFDFAGEYDLKAGDIVTITDGETPRTHVALNLSLTTIDPTTDTITGQADPGARVVLWPHEFDQVATVYVIASPDGAWLADFTGLFDLVPGTGGRSEILDEEGNATAVDWNVPFNQPPTDIVITAPVAPVPITQPVTLQVDFNDPDENDDHSVVIQWGDGTSATTNVTGLTAVAVHRYLAMGVYTINVTVTDSYGEAARAAYQYIVIYDPSGGFITGGGWFIDPATGSKAHFGFNPKYHTDGKLKGETEFRLGGLNFKSVSHDWMVINGAKGIFTASGTINGSGEYVILVSAIDGNLAGGADRIRIIIWNEMTGELVYDSQPGDWEYADPTTPIGGGSIVIHKAK